jgi:hypothetical protein
LDSSVAPNRVSQQILTELAPFAVKSSGCHCRESALSPFSRLLNPGSFRQPICFAEEKQFLRGVEAYEVEIEVIDLDRFCISDELSGSHRFFRR